MSWHFPPSISFLPWMQMIPYNGSSLVTLSHWTTSISCSFHENTFFKGFQLKFWGGSWNCSSTEALKIIIFLSSIQWDWRKIYSAFQPLSAWIVRFSHANVNLIITSLQDFVPLSVDYIDIPHFFFFLFPVLWYIWNFWWLPCIMCQDIANNL